MAITDLFIKRPVVAVVVNVTILLAGLYAATTLTVRQFPRNDNATVVITTPYVGADPELVAGFITTSIERAVSSADGVDYIESQSGRGVSIVSARLQLGYDASRALADISAKVDEVRGDLPAEAEVPILQVVSADSQFAAAYLSFGSDVLAPNQVTDYLVRVVQPRLASVPGVQSANILGARTFAMRAWLRTDDLAAFGLDATAVAGALRANNVRAAAGSVETDALDIQLSANTGLESVEDFERLVVADTGERLVRLRDVADVELGSESEDQEVRFSGQNSVFFEIKALPDANSLDVIRGIRAELASIQEDLPPQIEATFAYDATEYIEAALEEVVKTLIETLLIVTLVILAFLGSFRSVLIPVAAIPVSLIGAVFLIQLFGFTLNLLTILAIVLAVGLVVDDAIVVVENVERRIRDGMSRVEAAALGSRELVGPVISMTITLAAVYAPIAFQGGLTGSVFQEFALTLAGAVAISGVVALTLSPVMAQRLLPDADAKETVVSRSVSRALAWLQRNYLRALRGTLRYRAAIYVTWLLLVVATFGLFAMSPRELAPAEDQGVVFGLLNTPGNATIADLAPDTARIDRLLRDLDEGAYTFQITGPDGGFWGVALDSWEERTRSATEIGFEVQEKVGGIAGVEAFPITLPALPGGGNFPVEIVMMSTDEHDVMLEHAAKLQQAAAASGLFAFPPLIDVKYDRVSSRIVLDRDKVLASGLTMADVGAALASSLSEGRIDRFSRYGRSYEVIPLLGDADRAHPEQLAKLRLRTPGGELVPLGTLATFETEAVPRTLNRFDQLNAVKLSGVPTRTIADAVGFLEQEAAETLPRSYTLSYTGEARQLKAEGNSFEVSFAVALVLVFLVLAVQFNSFRDPLVVLAGSVPLAMFGAAIFTFLKMPNPMLPHWTDGWTTTMNIYSQVGLVTLVGLVAKNGILIVEFANEQQRAGLSKVDAVLEAARTRLRPILMTTTATVLGHFPLVLVTGAGASARNSIGVVLVAGMAIGSFFTLFFVPALYLLFATRHEAEVEIPARKAADVDLAPVAAE
ncbi:MAG: efflux RND transporter permease subunit [Myxococcota bacterium]